jgi:sec-independent protein translocase protein TatA
LRAPGFFATLAPGVGPGTAFGFEELSMSIGIWQVVLVLLIVLILFGAGKLPKVMGDLASGIKNFKRGMSEDEESSEAKKLESEKDSPVGEASTLSKDEAATKG